MGESTINGHFQSLFVCLPKGFSIDILNLVDCRQATKAGHQGHQGINQPILPDIFRVSVVLFWLSAC